jgi:hypothetical protein
MNCNRHRDAIRICGYRADRLDASHHEHMDTCELCRAWYREVVLRKALTTQPIPQPAAGFVDRVLASAVSTPPVHRWPSERRPARHWPARLRATNWAAAAVLAVAITGTLTLAVGLRESPPGDLAEVAQRQTRLVNVVIDASHRREDATVTIRLAEDLELEGYAGLHVIEFQTDLERGRNLLALPVRSKTGAGGEIWIALSHAGANEKTMRIHVNAG